MTKSTVRKAFLTTRTLAVCAVAGLLVAGAAATRTLADDAKSDGQKQQTPPGAVGTMAPNFTLTDTNGKQTTLATLLADKKTIVVLEWFNPDCPFVVKHHKTHSTFKDLATKYKDRNVVFLAINSGAPGKQGHGLERNQKAVTDYGITYPVLIDESGEVGRAYGARVTPHMFVIAADGRIAYNGAIDNNDDRSALGDINYVDKALTELLAGGSVTVTETRPYGCSVKYAG